MSGKLIATIGDTHTCPMVTGTTSHVGGTIITGASSVLVNNKPVARMGDKVICTGCGMVATIIQGDANVLVEGKPIAYVGCMHSHGGVITTGQANALLTGNKPPKIVTMPIEKIDFPNITIKDRVMASLAGHTKTLKEAETNITELKENAPKTREEEDSTEVTLTSTFAEDQLHFMAKKDSLVLFMGTFIQIFGSDIPAKAFKELYEDAQNKGKKLIPIIKVKKQITEGNGKGAFYSAKEVQEIWVSEQFIKDCEKDNQLRGELIVVLTEE